MSAQPEADALRYSDIIPHGGLGGGDWDGKYVRPGGLKRRLGAGTYSCYLVLSFTMPLYVVAAYRIYVPKRPLKSCVGLGVAVRVTIHLMRAEGRSGRGYSVGKRVQPQRRRTGWDLRSSSLLTRAAHHEHQDPQRFRSVLYTSDATQAQRRRYYRPIRPFARSEALAAPLNALDWRQQQLSLSCLIS